MNGALRNAVRLIAPLLAALGLGGCGDVEVATDMEFPKPLVEELPMIVGVYYSEEFRKYTHAEQRWGVDWKVELGKFHVRMGDRLFDATFRDTVAVKSLSELPGERPLRAVIEPRIEQYSFITPRDTGAKYYAVTIRYRLNVFAPDGRLADSLTFTGYGSSPSGGITSTNPMILATRSAMRDAAAKFLVQFAEQPIAKKMIAELPLIEATAAPGAAVAAGAAPPPAENGVIESVPIVDTERGPPGVVPPDKPVDAKDDNKDDNKVAAPPAAASPNSESTAPAPATGTPVPPPGAPPEPAATPPEPTKAPTKEPTRTQAGEGPTRWSGARATRVAD